jgi:hypothetical protein
MNTFGKNLPELVTKYLGKNGSDKWTYQINRQNNFDNVIVVPAIAEHNNIQNLLASLQQNDRKYFDRTLILFIINNNVSASEEIKLENYSTIYFLKNLVTDSDLNIGLIDASTGRYSMPDKEGGVGLARKIGMDLALRLFDYKSSRKKLLICLDADCIVDRNYLSTIVDACNNHNMNAAVVDYEHLLPENDFDKSAIINYEIFLRYYVLGLKYAGSPFAFHSVGSTMVCDFENYIKIGGMNKRKAAEDFYFLEKLAKQTIIHKIADTKVYPSSRGSWRVPFGTGQRINRFKAGTHNEYELFDPEVFEILKKWILLFNSESILSGSEYLSKAEQIKPELALFLKQNNFDLQWNKISNNTKSENQIQKQKTIWFDGFRTMKLIHYLRDNVFRNINMFDALDGLFPKINFEPHIKRNHVIPSIEVQLQYLVRLRDAESALTNLH